MTADSWNHPRDITDDERRAAFPENDGEGAARRALVGAGPEVSEGERYGVSVQLLGDLERLDSGVEEKRGLRGGAAPLKGSELVEVFLFDQVPTGVSEERI